MHHTENIPCPRAQHGVVNTTEAVKCGT